MAVIACDTANGRLLWPSVPTIGLNCPQIFGWK